MSFDDTNNKISFEKKIIIPLYTNNLSDWEKIEEYNVSMAIILNSNNGPGYYQDHKYVDIINELNKNASLFLGYIYTNYGKRDINEVKNDIDKWLEYYPNIKGFFIDEVDANDVYYYYYSNIYNYIKSKYFGNYKVFLNPGVIPENMKFFNIADNIIVFENDFSFIYILDQQKNFLENYKDKISLIVHGVLNHDNIKNIITNYSAKYYYISDDKTYSTIPSYFNLEINLIYNINN